jgi:hypothetical protein
MRRRIHVKVSHMRRRYMFGNLCVLHASHMRRKIHVKVSHMRRRIVSQTCILLLA